jgi:hypothetical protein
MEDVRRQRGEPQDRQAGRHGDVKSVRQLASTLVVAA